MKAFSNMCGDRAELGLDIGGIKFLKNMKGLESRYLSMINATHS